MLALPTSVTSPVISRSFDSMSSRVMRSLPSVAFVSAAMCLRLLPLGGAAQHEREHESGADERDEVRRPRPAPVERVAGLGLQGAQAGERELDEADGQQDGAGDAHDRVAAEALDRLDRLLLGVGANEVPELR